MPKNQKGVGGPKNSNQMMPAGMKGGKKGSSNSKGGKRY